MANATRYPMSLPNTRPSSPSAMSSTSDQAMSEPSSRPSLPTSVSDFALPSCASSSGSSSTLSSSENTGQPSSAVSQLKDDSTSFMQRLRRPTYQGMRSSVLIDTRMNSPLATSFTIPSPRRHIRHSADHDSEITEEMGNFRDGDSMVTDCSPSSGSDLTTPPLLGPSFMDENYGRRKYPVLDIPEPMNPSTPTRTSSAPAEGQDFQLRLSTRRLSHPPKPPRLLSLVAESRPEETEVKSEAQFQRLLASYTGLPSGIGHNKTTRALSNRGRYPEEAGVDEEVQREDTPSDDGVAEKETVGYNYNPPSGGSEPINIVKPSTPIPSMAGTPDEALMMAISESPGGNGMMDVDMPGSTSGSPSFSAGVGVPGQWRQTPPPTSSAVRTNKRKYEERFDPYAPSVKRRAGSPSIASLRDAHSSVSPIIIPRSPVLRPRTNVSHSQNNSATSSPTVMQSSSGLFSNGSSFASSLSNSLLQYGANGAHPVHIHHRSGSMSSSSVSSPTVRASMMLASPVLRPVPRLAVGSKKGTGEAEEVDGAGEGVSSLSLR